ncbi:MAG: hypothetical protein ABII80_03900 [bacterium]
MTTKSSAPLRSPGGYTLVELMIITSVIAVLVIFGLSAYTKGKEREQALAVKETILSVIQGAQKRATVGDADCTGLYQGENITTTSGSSSITTTSICQYSSGTPQITSLPNTIFSDSLSITFLPLGKGIDLGGSTSLDLNYQINTNSNYQINITAPGVFTYNGEQ